MSNNATDTSMARRGDAVERRSRLFDDRVSWLTRMMEIRLIEDRVIDLFGEGLIPGTTHTAQGQEAVAVGIAAATRITDTIACTYRGHALALALGAMPEAILGEILGRQIGCMGGLGGSMHLSDPSIGLLPTMAIVGAGIPVAVGAALSAQVRGADAVAISVFGDGATNIGAFHEGLNLAAVWNLPVVFICENNLYGEYSRIDRTTAVMDIAKRAESYAMPSDCVDGQDVDAVRESVDRAVGRARDGEGPTLIEAKTYRYKGHSRSDPAKYRPEGELESWTQRDPITLYSEKLLAEGVLDADGIERCWESQRNLVEAALEIALNSPVPTEADMFNRIYTPEQS